PEQIEESSHRAVEIVKQLLTLSRKKELIFTPVDLNKSIRNVMKICTNTFDKRIRLEPTYTDEPAIVFADPGQLGQVLLNLCVNAAHAMTIMKKDEKTWGGALRVTLESMVADEAFCENHPGAEQGHYWILSISDDGIGMSRKTITEIFAPFFTTKGNDQGTGLGLSMVFNIIKQHKGIIRVYSEIGKGSKFSVYLPVLTEDEIDEKQTGEEEDFSGEGLILVVDDEPIMRKIASKILENSGYSVITACDGREAVNIFAERRQEIVMVLLDMLMPVKCGKDAFFEMKKIQPDVKALLASGFRRDERVEEALKAGVKAFIEKPYTFRQLAREVYYIVNDLQKETDT
ncbi:MAG: response regulator, partial [bacterium]|nr:response regulator [bacterium]